MNNFFVISNEQKDPNLQTAHFICSTLKEKGKNCVIQEQSVNSPSGRYRYTDARQVPPDTECALVLGGDGTLLLAARDLIETGIPLLGVNMGSLGFLAGVEKKNIPEVIDKLIQDEYMIEDRMMLSGEAWHKNRRILQDSALNDIVITRTGKMRVVDFHIYVDGVFLYSYAADGIIVSTPTGSTGYSLSSGGPIVAPEASLILLTAIAPHTLNSRPIVLPDCVEVMVEIGSEHASETDGAEASFDGDTSVKLNVGDRIVISKAEQKTRLIKTNNTSFLELLREKLNK